MESQREELVNNEFLETTFRPKEWVIQKIESMIETLLFDIANKRPPVINSVSNKKRKEYHSRYDSKSGILRRKNNDLSNKQIRFLSPKTSKTFAIMIRILDICHELLVQNATATKRDIYYKDVKLFGNPQTVDLIIDELACLFRIPRSCLNVIASSKGLVAGSLKLFQNNRIVLDCLPTNDQDIATRQLVKKLGDLRRPYETYPFLQILGFFDNDPYGIEILCVYKFGSSAKSFDNENLATPSIKWLGLRYSDRKKIPRSSLIRITTADRKKAYHLLQRDYLQVKWRVEICRMLYIGYKAEIQSLCDEENGNLLKYLKSKMRLFVTPLH
ncbi:12675_t:CDS:10 [Funneliformis mosseae]|uniref:DNA topoisomerase (ATP-hydrolyzing) n=1 Tax=Funneliformis mosseae TaxID=27381 RepID=A0A9N8VBF2_FUNMO|nr:12675_t:CDS:10 [Funneliformis mosseae]